MLQAVGPDIEADLRGHALVSEFVSVRGEGQFGVSASRGKADGFGTPHRFELHGGLIELAGKSAGVLIPKATIKASIWSDWAKSRRAVRLGAGQSELAVTPAARNYLARSIGATSTENRVSNMTIKVGYLGVVMTGRKNTIRNSRIEVRNPKAGIYLFGPDNLIENNILIFRGNAQTDSAAPIKLHAANGTIIRNNIIIIEARKPRQAISLIETSDVLISNNRIYGASDLVRAFDDISSFRSTDNRMGSRLEKPRLRPKDRNARRFLK